MADSSEVLNLLRIADLSKNWPHLKHLHDHAMDQLNKINEEHGPSPSKKEEAAPRSFPRRSLGDE